MKNILLIFLTFLSITAFGQASQISFADKDKTLPLSDPARNFRDVDANEIKAVVNANATLLNLKAPSLSPTLTTPNLGVPTFITLTNATGLPISTGLTGAGSGVLTFLATPTSANLATAVTNETGTGALVFGTSPTFTTPILGTPTSVNLSNATSLSLTTGVTGTLPVANGGTGITSLGSGIATFLGTPTSANLATAVTNETGSGALVFGTSPTLTTPALGTPSAVVLTSGTGLPLTTGVTGILPVANGGTGQATSVIAAAITDGVSTSATDQNTLFDALVLKAAVASFVTRETPSGSVNGINLIFTAANTPVVGSEMVFRNGVLQEITTNYTISGANVTFIVAPETGDLIRFTYRK